MSKKLNEKVKSNQLSRQDLTRHVGHMDQIAGIKFLQGADGVERGVRVLKVWTGSGLTYDVLADRGLDISTCQYNGLSLTWRSPIGDAHPTYYDASGDAWLRSFQGGMMVTCGLDTFGPPSVDNGEELGQHGRASNLPAQYLNYEVGWEDDSYMLRISGETRQIKVYRENLLLKRTITSWMGSNKIQINDTIINEGYKSHPHMILYDFNIGYPFLCEDSRLKLDVLSTSPFDEIAESEMDEWMIFQPPTPDYQERDYIHKPEPDADGWANAVLENPNLDLAVKLSFDQTNLPYLAEWKMMGEGLYVLALQPMNCGVWGGRAKVREENALPFLEPGERRDYQLELEVLESC